MTRLIMEVMINQKKKMVGGDYNYQDLPVPNVSRLCSSSIQKPPTDANVGSSATITNSTMRPLNILTWVPLDATVPSSTTDERYLVKQR